jgi:hypothetical protein
MFSGVRWGRPTSEFDTRPARDVPDSKLADQLRLVETIALPLGGDVGQSIKGQPSFGPLVRLPLVRLHRPPGCGLGCGHVGGGQRLPRHRQAVR